MKYFKVIEKISVILVIVSNDKLYRVSGKLKLSGNTNLSPESAKKGGGGQPFWTNPESN